MKGLGQFRKVIFKVCERRVDLSGTHDRFYNRNDHFNFWYAREILSFSLRKASFVPENYRWSGDIAVVILQVMEYREYHGVIMSNSPVQGIPNTGYHSYNTLHKKSD
ncbi:MAG: hypothetical protein PHU54_09900 [Candidatus Omnitrophica bacterium]|jgi:hypothetical protein|nr:hypothetical protein [Candidatus Omnitrophota bacterium]